VPPLNGVVSRKTHGSLTPPPAGPGDLTLNLNPSTPATIEPRLGGSSSGNHTLVFTFLNTLTGPGATSITATADTGSGPQPLPQNQISGSIGTDAHDYIVNLTGVPNASHVSVTLHGVSDSAGNSGDIAPVRMDVLLGDTTGNGAVNSSDVAQTQSQSGQPVTSANFREDVTVNGAINSSDVALVQSKSGTALP
jgi:hypothetical protein